MKGCNNGEACDGRQAPVPYFEYGEIAFDETKASTVLVFGYLYERMLKDSDLLTATSPLTDFDAGTPWPSKRAADPNL